MRITLLQIREGEERISIRAYDFDHEGLRRLQRNAIESSFLPEAEIKAGTH